MTMATYIRAVSISGPSLGPLGVYLHTIRWETNGRDGFIIQHVQRHETYVDAAHDERFQDDYWEAWRVDNHGGIFPRVPPGPWNDSFNINNTITNHPAHARAVKSTGHWRIKGTVYWVSSHRFDHTVWQKSAVPGAGGGAGILYRRPNPPPFALGIAFLRRNEAGEWDGNVHPAIHHRRRVFGSKL